MLQRTSHRTYLQCILINQRTNLKFVANQARDEIKLIDLFNSFSTRHSLADLRSSNWQKEEEKEQEEKDKNLETVFRLGQYRVQPRGSPISSGVAQGQPDQLRSSPRVAWGSPSPVSSLVYSFISQFDKNKGSTRQNKYLHFEFPQWFNFRTFLYIQGNFFIQIFKNFFYNILLTIIRTLDMI